MQDVPESVQRAIDTGALVVANDSGGKDSQRSLMRVAEVVPRAQIVVVHASLGTSEWPGALEHAQGNAERLGVPFIVARAVKTFQDLVRHRHRTYPGVPAFPLAAQRQCTSDLKRGPIEREVRRHAARHGVTQIVTTMGIRAEESPGRAKAKTCRLNRSQSVAGRTWQEWLPIHDLSREQVIGDLADAGQDLHPAYGAGNDRLSCIFCLLSSRRDLINGAEHNPDLYAEYVELERETGSTLHMSRKTLPELTGIRP